MHYPCTHTSEEAQTHSSAILNIKIPLQERVYPLSCSPTIHVCSARERLRHSSMPSACIIFYDFLATPLRTVHSTFTYILLHQMEFPHHYNKIQNSKLLYAFSGFHCQFIQGHYSKLYSLTHTLSFECFYCSYRISLLYFYL